MNRKESLKKKVQKKGEESEDKRNIRDLEWIACALSINIGLKDLGKQNSKQRQPIGAGVLDESQTIWLEKRRKYFTHFL